ncbi:TetR/AcrR family transcriptional regulator [Arthrobacter sp. NPDC058288]|uniref:TetR/AcrR family transcriptional regulator n=1 Tax=Arthrobacter sp. NPDC058288 TaxID=3346424 RepID=UPI0036E1F7A6
MVLNNTARGACRQSGPTIERCVLHGRFRDRRRAQLPDPGAQTAPAGRRRAGVAASGGYGPVLTPYATVGIDPCRRCEKGYAATTIDEIAAAAGTTRVTFYAYYPSRSDLMKDFMARVNAVLDRADCSPCR